ncbi:MAG: amino acid permease [Prevotellaceae bacterium]|jgi:amino acid transporter|nr:amino acid permease [Prevotellaceae bacterium]
MKENKALWLKNSGLGTAPIYFTAISTILGAVLFLRLGYATGTLGFWGAILLIIIGHLITIPTALAISEIATNKRVEGGGEYFIISRSFGLKIGSTIGIALFFSQSISVAFYIIAFAEAFTPLFNWWLATFDFELPRQAISIPALGVLAYIMLRKGTGSGLKTLYIVNGILAISLLLFFLGGMVGGSPAEAGENAVNTAKAVGDNFGFFNGDSFFIVFAICFPAFTGMTAGVGLSGDLKNPGKSIPMGTMAATITGLVVYMLIVWKLSVSASQADLQADQFVMARIALWGAIAIPVGLAASTFTSAMGSIMVAPRTLQALAYDKSFPLRRLNYFLAKGKGKTKEPYNASLISFLIAVFFVLLGDINTVAGIISMFFLITYGSLCLISFLNHFGAPPSYRPRFKSKWYFSLGGFILSVWVMFMINALYTVIAYLIIVLIYLTIESYNKDQKGLVNIFKGALFQLNRRIQVFMQKQQSNMETEEWRPAVICISPNSFERYKVLDLMQWLSHKHGFGTYIHYIEDYFNKQTYTDARKILKQLIDNQRKNESTLYIDTIISPSYTAAIVQIIQSPSISGMENNMVVFEFEKERTEELKRILENVNLVKAGNFDVCIFAGSKSGINYRNGIHVWIRNSDEINTNLMILLGYIIMAHPDWHKGYIKIFNTCAEGHEEETKEDIQERVAAGRLPITLANIEIITLKDNRSFTDAVNEHSKHAGLTMIGFNEETTGPEAVKLFVDFHGIGDILFVHSSQSKNIG